MMDNNKKIDDMLKKKVWAVVGATPDSRKAANKIYHTLRSHGYEAYAVNPHYEEMEDGSKCYSCIDNLPMIPDCIDFVVPPQVTIQSLEELDPEITPFIWLQPGTYNREIVEFAEKKGFKVVHKGACVMSSILSK